MQTDICRWRLRNWNSGQGGCSGGSQGLSGRTKGAAAGGMQTAAPQEAQVQEDSTAHDDDDDGDPA